MNEFPYEIGTDEFRELLQNDPQVRAAFDNFIETQLRRQHVAALEELIQMMKDPEHKVKEVLALSSRVSYPGRPMVEDVPKLIELERLAYQIPIYSYHSIEMLALKQLSDLIRHEELLANEELLKDLLDLLTETYHYTRKRDRFASKRRFFSMKLVINIAAHTKDEQKLALLYEGLNHKTPKIRAESLIHVYQAYNWLGHDIPASLLDHFKQMTETDRSKKVRYTAQTVLHEIASEQEM